MHVIGTAGHVDHGKSTLVERLTGIDPDRFEEEKRRGLTIDLGFAWLRLPSGREVGLIDVPGHERFIKNMLAGAGGMSICLFVVAANEGWMPQSAEHLAILDVLGISSGVVALTKSDTVDAEIIEIARAEIHERLEPTTLVGAPVVACSAATGEGLADLVDAIDKMVGGAPPPLDAGRPRLWVDRVFTIAGAGTVVTGTLAGGSFAVGDEIELAPEGRRARIRALQTHKRKVDHVGPGNRVALNLAGLQRQGAARGDVVVQPGRWRPTGRVDARVQVLAFDVIGREHVLTEKGAHLLYAGSAETPVKLKLLGAQRLRPGEAGFAQLTLRDPLPLVRGDRFVLRDAGRVVTFGGGIVLDPLPGLARRSDARRAALLERMSQASAEATLEAIVEAEQIVDAAEALLRSSAGALPDTVARLGPVLVSRGKLRTLEERASSALAAHHLAHPLERGMQREALRAETGLEPAAFDDLLRRMSDIVEEGPGVRLATHAVTFDPAQQRAQQELIERLSEAGFTPPPVRELRADPALLRALVASGSLVKIGDFYLTSGRAAEARRRVRARIESDGPVTVAGIRDLLGTSRKYAVPLCEWLDATGATRRQGDLRTLGPTL
ncbi:MAG: selenocysteine-specific translation elongation factor [Actinomycetota bacterium]